MALFRRFCCACVIFRFARRSSFRSGFVCACRSCILCSGRCSLFCHALCPSRFCFCRFFCRAFDLRFGCRRGLRFCLTFRFGRGRGFSLCFRFCLSFRLSFSFLCFRLFCRSAHPHVQRVRQDDFFLGSAHFQRLLCNLIRQRFKFRNDNRFLRLARLFCLCRIRRQSGNVYRCRRHPSRQKNPQRLFSPISFPHIFTPPCCLIRSSFG